MNKFSVKKGNLELRSCNNSLLQEGIHTTAEIVEWNQGKQFCFTLASWIKDDECYDLKFVGSRPFESNWNDFSFLAKTGNTILSMLFKDLLEEENE